MNQSKPKLSVLFINKNLWIATSYRFGCRDWAPLLANIKGNS